MADSTAHDGRNLHQDDGYKLVTVAYVVSILSIIVVAARFYASQLKKAKIGPDDWMSIPALIACVGHNANCIVVVKVGGVGRHVGTITDPEVLILWGKCLYSQLLIYVIAIVLPKLAILLFYLRIFPSPNFRLSVYLLAIFVISWAVAVEFSTIFQCTPISYFWARKPPGRCINWVAFYRWASLPNILSDIIMLLLPVHRVWKIQVTFKQKMAVSGLFLMGGLGTIASAVRMSILFRRNTLVDPTWISADVLIWSVLECGLVLIAACLPTLMPLFHGVSVVLQERWTHSSGAGDVRNPSGPDSLPSWRTKGGLISTPQRGFARIDGQRNFYHGHSDGQGDAVPLTPLPVTPGGGYRWAIPKTSL